MNLLAKVISYRLSFFFVSTTHTTLDIKKSKKNIKIAITFRGRGFDHFDPRLLSIKLGVELSLNGLARHLNMFTLIRKCINKIQKYSYKPQRVSRAGTARTATLVGGSQGWRRAALCCAELEPKCKHDWTMSPAQRAVHAVVTSIIGLRYNNIDLGNHSEANYNSKTATLVFIKLRVIPIDGLVALQNPFSSVAMQLESEERNVGR
uniref:SFRICE_030961 n=1 Tax=Spodoptera frugiperda TaxID=7108 RepID=A0A2H1WB45_SPOFR